MIKIIAFTTLLISSLTFAAVEQEIANVVKDTIVDEYSEGWDNERFEMSRSDVWNLEYDEDVPPACTYLVTAYAKKPSYHGSTTHSVWVCVIRKSCGKVEGFLWADDQIADE